MSLKHYLVDLRSLSEEERRRVYDLLDRITETGLSITPDPYVFDCFLDEKMPVTSIPGLPEGLIRQIP